MSDDRIENYQSSMGAAHRAGNYNKSRYHDQQDKIMRSILTDVQYDKYQMMKSNRANETDQ